MTKSAVRATIRKARHKAAGELVTKEQIKEHPKAAVLYAAFSGKRGNHTEGVPFDKFTAQPDISDRVSRTARKQARERKAMMEAMKALVTKKTPYVKQPGWLKKSRSKATQALLLELAREKRERRAARATA